MRTTLGFVLFVSCLLDHSLQHAIFGEPPARQSMGMEIGKKVMCNLPRNNDHMSVWCGGAGPMHNSVNKGRCGICGDEYSAPVKQFQAGGKFATGTIARSYQPGQEINVEIKLVANHKGFFTFALCAHNDPNSSPNRECFLNNQLTVNNGARYYATGGTGLKSMKVKLPDGLTCKQCILQMTYTSGNNWGAGPQSAEVQSEDCVSTKGKLGCGPQETFRGCSDICIGSFCPTALCAKVGDVSGGGTGPVVTPTPKPVTPVTRPTARPVGDICVAAGVKKQYFSVKGDLYCRAACLDKARDVCYKAANAKFLCDCSNGRGRSLDYYPAVMLEAIKYPDNIVLSR